MSGTNLTYPVTMDVSKAMRSLDELDKKLSSLARTVSAQVNVTASGNAGQADQGAREAKQAQRDANAAERQARAEMAAEQREQNATLRQIHAQDAAEQREQAQATRQFHAQIAAERREQAEVLRQIDASEAAAQKQAREALRGLEQQELNERRLLIEFEEQAVAEQLAAQRAIQATIKEQNVQRMQAEAELGRAAVARIRELKIALQEGLTEASYEARGIASGVRSGFSNANATSRLNLSGVTATAREDTAMSEASADVLAAKARADMAAAAAGHAKLNAAQNDTLQNRIAAERAMAASAVANSNLLAAEQQAATVQRIAEVSRVARAGASEVSSAIMQQTQAVAQAQLAAGLALATQKQTATEAEKAMEATVAARAKADAAGRIQAQAEHAAAQEASAANLAAVDNATAASRRANSELQAAQARENAAVQVAQQREADAAAAQGRLEQAAAERNGSVQRLEIIKTQAVQQAALLEQEGTARLANIRASIEQQRVQAAIQIAQMRSAAPSSAGGAAAEQGLMSSAAGGVFGGSMGFLGMTAAMGSIGGVESVIKAGRAMEMLHNTMLAATGSEQNAAAQMDYVRQYADKMGLSLTTAGEAYGKLLIPAREAGLTILQTQKIFEGFTTASTALHLTDDKTQRVLFDLTKMASEGRIYARDVNNLSRLLPGGTELFSGALGMTVEEFRQGTKKGQFDVSDIVKIAEYIKTHFQEAADSASGSMTGAFNRMGTALFDFKNEIAHGGFFQAMTEELGQLSKALNSDDGKHLAHTLGTVLADGVYALGHGIQFVVEHATALEVILGGLAAYKGFGLLTSGVGLLAAGMGSAVTGMVKMGVAGEALLASTTTVTGLSTAVSTLTARTTASATAMLASSAAGKAMAAANAEAAAATAGLSLAEAEAAAAAQALAAAQAGAGAAGAAAGAGAASASAGLGGLITSLGDLGTKAMPAAIAISGIVAALLLYKEGTENVDLKEQANQRSLTQGLPLAQAGFRHGVADMNSATSRGEVDAALARTEQELKKAQAEAERLAKQKEELDKAIAASQANMWVRGNTAASDWVAGKVWQTPFGPGTFGAGAIKNPSNGANMTLEEAQQLSSQLGRSSEGAPAKIAKMKEDLEELAKLRNSVLPSLPGHLQVDLEAIARRTEEANKRAEFLRNNPQLAPLGDKRSGAGKEGTDALNRIVADRGTGPNYLAGVDLNKPMSVADINASGQIDATNRTPAGTSAAAAGAANPRDAETLIRILKAEQEAQQNQQADALTKTTAQLREDAAAAGDDFKKAALALARRDKLPRDENGVVIDPKQREQNDENARTQLRIQAENHPKGPTKAERFENESDAEAANAERQRQAMIQGGLPALEHQIALQQAEAQVRKAGIDIMSAEGQRYVQQTAQKIELAAASKKTIELLREEMSLTAANVAAQKSLAAFQSGNPRDVYTANLKAKQDEAAAKAGADPANQARARANVDIAEQTAATNKLAEMTVASQNATKAANIEMQAWGSNGSLAMEKITVAIQRQQQEQQILSQYNDATAQKMISLLHDQWTAQDQLNQVKIASAERDKMISSTVDNVATAFESMTKSGSKLKNVLHDLVGSMGKTAMSTFVTGPLKTLLSGGSFSDPHVSGGAMSLMGMLGIGGGYKPDAVSAAVPGSATSQIGANGALTSAGAGLLGRLFGASGAAASVASANMTVATANITVTSALGSVGGGVGGSAGGWLSSLFGGSSSSGAAGAAGATGAGTDIMAARANGGEVDGGWAKPTLVGERGPELFWPKVSGSVMNNNDYANMVRSYSGGGGSSSGGGNTVHAPITIVAPNPQAFSESQGQVASRIQDMMRAGMRNR